MCSPIIPTVFGAVSALSAGAGFVAQRQQAKAQQAALDQARQAQAEEIAAKRDLTLNQRVAAARREAARRIVAAGEAGVGGVSAALDVMNVLGRYNIDAADIIKSAQFEDRASQLNYQSELARINKPTIIDGALAIVGGYHRGHELAQRLTIKGRTRPNAS